MCVYFFIDFIAKTVTLSFHADKIKYKASKNQSLDQTPMESPTNELSSILIQLHIKAATKNSIPKDFQSQTPQVKQLCRHFSSELKGRVELAKAVLRKWEYTSGSILCEFLVQKMNGKDWTDKEEIIVTQESTELVISVFNEYGFTLSRSGEIYIFVKI